MCLKSSLPAAESWFTAEETRKPTVTYVTGKRVYKVLPSNVSRSRLSSFRSYDRVPLLCGLSRYFLSDLNYTILGIKSSANINIQHINLFYFVSVIYFSSAGSYYQSVLFFLALGTSYMDTQWKWKFLISRKSEMSYISISFTHGFLA